MKVSQHLYLGFILLASLLVGGCEKEPVAPNVEPEKTEYIAFCDLVHNTDEGNYLDIGWFTFNGSFIDADNKEADAETRSFTLNGDVTYSYQVTEKVSGPAGVISMSKKDYDGKLKESAFNTAIVNKIEVVRDGTAWKLLVNGADAEVAGGGGGNNTGTSGIWKRIESPKGYQTDLAVGGIPGEPANRVYMCEHPGSPSAGLYKGTISGETITWDAVHGLPTAKFYERDGFMRLWFSVAPEDEAGKYVKGVWTNTCGPLENSVKKIAVGFNPGENQNQYYSILSVKVENTTCPVTQLSTAVPAPDCTSGKFINSPSSSANPDYYTVSITYSSIDMNGQQYTKTEQSVIYKVHLANDCNKFKVDNSGTGRWVLLPL